MVWNCNNGKKAERSQKKRDQMATPAREKTKARALALIGIFN
jgi:hypothetical protein